MRIPAALRFNLPRCPNCRSIEFRRVDAENLPEKLFYWILQPCRCDFCGRHLYLFRWQAPVLDSPQG
jgi:hypothetical protein